jgi:hypothetical protein
MEEHERMYHNASDEALDIVMRGLQLEQRELNRAMSEVLHQRTVNYAARLSIEGYEDIWKP